MTTMDLDEIKAETKRLSPLAGAAARPPGGRSSSAASGDAAGRSLVVERVVGRPGRPAGAGSGGDDRGHAGGVVIGVTPPP
jgi:hypothetical protein